MTARTNPESDRQDYDNPKVQDLPRRNYGTMCMEHKQAVLGKESRRKSTEGSMAREVTLVDSDNDITDMSILSIRNRT